MKRVELLHTSEGDFGGWVIDCPACGFSHLFDARWTFNGNEEFPTFRPSMLVHALGDRPRCHSFVTDGRIEFLSDCTHAYAGQTLDVPDISTSERWSYD